MFDFTSRYARQEVAVYFAPDGSDPDAKLSYRALADPLQYWRVADANDALNPFDLEVPGRVLRVPVPQP